MWSGSVPIGWKDCEDRRHRGRPVRRITQSAPRDPPKSGAKEEKQGRQPTLDWRPSLDRTPNLSYFGQEASISAKTVSRSAAPDAQSVMPFQKEPAPTSPGIKSDPSKRKLVALASTSATADSSGIAYISGVASCWTAKAPPSSRNPDTDCASVKYSIRARASGLSLK